MPALLTAYGGVSYLNEVSAMLKILSFVSLYLICQSSVLAGTCGTVESLRWLVGNWHSDNGKVKINESWMRVSANTIEGYGQTYSIKKNKIVISETLRLVEMSGEVFFVAKVASNDLPISFKLTSCADKTAIFENPQHDFPKKIRYQFNNTKSITAFVSGENGKGFKIEFIRENDS